MMGLCYCCSLLTLCIFFLVAVVIMNVCHAAVLVAVLLGIVGSAPLSEKRDSMDMDTINPAHSLISKILEDIPRAHASWITSPSLILGSSVNLELQHLKENLVPSAPVLESISENFTLEVCLDNIFNGLKLHLNLLKELVKTTNLQTTEQVAELQAGIEELMFFINKLQNEAGFERTMQPSDQQAETSENDPAENVTYDYKTQVAAHLTLQQLQMFSSNVLRSIQTFRDMTSGSEDSRTLV